MALHTILLDADGVLFHRPGGNPNLNEYLQKYGIEPRHPVVVQRALKAAHFDVLRGRITREEFYDARLRFQGLEDDALPGGRAAIMADAALIEPVEDVLDVLPDIHNRGFDLVIVANTEHGADDLRTWLKAAGFSPDLWSGIFTSSEVRIASPEPDFFAKVLETTGGKWDESLYILREERSLAALMERGMKTVGFKIYPTDTFHIHHTIQTFTDLSDLLFKLNDYGDTLLHDN